MATWRPVRGEIVRFDRSLATLESIEGFFADHRIIARGLDNGDTYEVELAVTGWRQRVATLNEEGDLIVPGLSVADLVEQMDKVLRKVQIEIDGHVAWGNIDLGEVDVSWDVDDVDAPVYLPSPSSVASPANPVSSARPPAATELAPGADEEGVEGAFPDLPEGPMLMLSDVSFAELPRFAAAANTPIAAFESKSAKAVLADAPISGRAALSAPEFVILLSTDPTGLDAPVLVARQDTTRLVWDWDYHMTDLPWVRENEEAAQFTRDQLGEGALVTRIADDLDGVDPERLREALLGDSHEAARALTNAIGLPAEVADCLDGFLEARMIPGAVVFEPKPFSERLQTTVAYEVAGRGRAAPGFWSVFRKLYLNHPHVMEGIAAAQAGAGSIAIAAAAKDWARPRGKVLAGIGGALLFDAATRLFTTQWLQAALEYEGLLPWNTGSAESPAEAE